MVELFFGETLELIVVYSLENIHLKSDNQGEQLLVVVYNNVYFISNCFRPGEMLCCEPSP